MFWDGLLETVMLVCFAAAWPASIYKSWTSETRKGKSLFFLLIVLAGYIAGVTRITIRDTWSFIIVPYTINTLLVTIDLVLYYRNYRIDEGKPQIFSDSTHEFFREYFYSYRYRKRGK